jgi:hypothetical protein
MSRIGIRASAIGTNSSSTQAQPLLYRSFIRAPPVFVTGLIFNLSADADEGSGDALTVSSGDAYGPGLPIQIP